MDPPGCPSDGYRDALRYLYDRINYERLAPASSARYPFRLKRFAELMRQLNLRGYLYADSPVPAVPLVHVAGTKGKGSVSSLVAAAISASGLRTGLYTSPHLQKLEERFRVDGATCTSDDFVSLVGRVQSAAQELEQTRGGLSFFELTTAMAMLHFDTCQCDAVVIEVGLGGRLDSTNVLAPSVSVITSIGMDHQHVLGHDLVSIAKEKAGIIKPVAPVVSGVQDPEASRVVRDQSDRHGVQHFELGRDFTFDHLPLPDWGSTVEFHGMTPPLSREISVRMAMEGRHQARNAAIALATLDLLRATPPASNSHACLASLNLEAIRAAFSQTQCEARLEYARWPHDVVSILDASHNEDSINALCCCLRDRSANRPITIVFGTSLDKDAEVMLSSLSQLANRLILTRYHGNPRFRPPEELAALVPESIRGVTSIMDDPLDACRVGHRLASPGGTLVICGSFFLAAETRDWWLQQSHDA
jgi:dihydrofolate synthase/folylpolyglutamate synthase